MNKLKGKKEWTWNKEHDKAFEELKEKITSQLVLFLLKREGKFRVKTDTSEHTIGGVLFQEQEGKWKPIAFLSRTIQLFRKELQNLQQRTTGNCGSFG